MANGKITNQMVRDSFRFTRNTALRLLEDRAREILAAHPKLSEFVVSPTGGVLFTCKDGSTYPLADAPAYCKPIRTLLDEWDSVLFLSNVHMRITARKGKSDVPK